jgi:hypothetical protein
MMGKLRMVKTANPAIKSLSGRVSI